MERNEEDWNGAINMIKNDAKKNHDDLLEKFTAKVDLIRNSIDDFKLVTNQKDRDLRKVISDLMKS